MAEKTGLVRQWPGYLWRGATAALASVILQCGVDLAFGVQFRGVIYLAGDWLGNLAFFALAQALFPSFIVRFKHIPTALGVSLALGGFAGYVVSWLFSRFTGLVPFSGQQVFLFLFVGTFLGLATGVGWNLAKGRAVLFWAGFLAACAVVTAFYHFTAPVEVRETRDIFDQGLTLVAGYLPVVAVIWWRHRPRGDAAAEPSDSPTTSG
ncbi:MAG TPA: hypothetical protein VM054_04635 [bacterium]|nr:hypothetical protein [bacterium]